MSDQEPKVILLVDDVGYNRVLVERAMDDPQYEIISVGSAQEAITILKNDFRIKAVITDLMMPEMDGLELMVEANKMERLNDEGRVPAPPFILLTASSDTNKLQKAKDLGFVDVLLKPFDKTRLLKSLMRAFRRGEEQDELEDKQKQKEALRKAPENDLKAVREGAEAIKRIVQRKDPSIAAQADEVMKPAIDLLNKFLDTPVE